MKKLRVLAAATGLSRFSAQELTCLTQVSEKTVYQLLDELIERGSLTRSEKPEGLRGRPRFEFVWNDVGLSVERTKLRRLLPKLHIDTEGDPWIIDSVVDGLQRTNTLLSAAETINDPMSLRLVHARLEAVLEMFDSKELSLTAEHRVAITAAEMRFRALKAQADAETIHVQLAGKLAEPLFEALECLPRASLFPSGMRSLSRMPFERFVIVLDVLGAERATKNVRMAVEAQGLGCIVMPLQDASEERRTRALEYLAAFFLSPVTSFCVFVLADFGKNEFSSTLCQPISDPLRLRSVVERVLGQYEEVLSLNANRPSVLALGSSTGTANANAVLRGRGRTGVVHDFLKDNALSDAGERFAFVSFLMNRPVLLEGRTQRRFKKEFRSHFECHSTREGDLGEFVRAVVHSRPTMGAGAIPDPWLAFSLDDPHEADAAA